MGNHFSADPRVRVFASPSSWIEGAAISQLMASADRRGTIAVAGMPDLHPGHKGPVGCAILTDGVVHPDIVGADIGCGVTVWKLDARYRQIRLDRAVRALERLGDDWADEAERHGMDASLPDVAQRHLRTLGTVGGGNHFVELQTVDSVCNFDPADGLAPGDMLVVVHSGSRSLGPAVHARRGDARDGLDLDGAGRAYLDEHDAAMAFASLNRRLLAQRAIGALGLDGEAWLDVPHNYVEVTRNGVLHRKGASPADHGLVPVLGSRGAMTHLVMPDHAVEGALASIAHGAGRKRDRASMVDRVKSSSREWKERPNPIGNRVICADKRLEAEEAPEAYKDIRRVVSDLVEHGIARPVAVLRPVVTFKTMGRRHDD